jgi:DNA-binding transcriptional regulator YiaG
MTNIAKVLKEEIARIARKQLRAEVSTLKRAATRHRSDIAALKRQVADLAKRLAAEQRRRGAAAAAPRGAEPADAGALQRFSAKGFASHRRRLGLSAAQLGRMFGVSGQTIYLWETGRARPRAKHMQAVAALRSMGRRGAAAVLERVEAG